MFKTGNFETKTILCNEIYFTELGLWFILFRF